MADFEREAELSIVIPDRTLRDARSELEDALADIPVGVDAGAGGVGAGRGAGRSSRQRRRDRREFRWARQRTDDVERQVELLENIEGELTEGGLGGGGGLFGDLLGLGGEGAGIATDLGTSLVDVIAPALGSLVGTAVGQQVGGGGGAGGGATLSVQEPLGVTVENTPLAVEGSRQRPVVEVETPDVNPRFEPVFRPTFRPTFTPDFSTDVTVRPELDLPDLNVSGGGAGLTEPVDVLVQNTPLPVSGRAPIRRPTFRDDAPGGGGSADFGERFRRGLREIPIIGGPLADFSETQTRRIERVTPGVSPDGRDGGGGAPAGVSASAGDVSVTVNADVQSAVQETVEQVRREQERQRQELRRELQNEINDLRRQIQSGGRSGLGGSVQ